MADGNDDEGEAALIEDEAPEDSASSCSQRTVCNRSMPVTRLGLICVHGPVLNHCPGSRKPPACINTCQRGLHAGLQATQAPSEDPEESPSPSRDLSARKLAEILNRVSSDGSESSWDRLFCFPARCLRVPDRGGHRRSLASHTNQLIKEEADPTFVQSAPNRRTGNFAHDPVDTLAGRVSAKLEERDFKGAVRLASSEASIAVPSSEMLAALWEKHPLPHPDSAIPLVSTEDQPRPVQVSEDELARTICSFTRGSAGGPDALRPQHLKEMISKSALGGGQMLLQSVTFFMNCVLRGEATASVRASFFGA